jgi:maleate isomerase
MIRADASDGADAIVVLCTNLDGAALAASLESELDIAVLDPVAVTLWRTLELAGADPQGAVGLGPHLRHGRARVW